MQNKSHFFYLLYLASRTATVGSEMQPILERSSGPRELKRGLVSAKTHGTSCVYSLTPVAAAEPSAIEDISSKNLPSICDSFGSDFGCLSLIDGRVACSPDENQQKVCFARNVAVPLHRQSEQTASERHENKQIKIINKKSNI